jgi:hypothetical protein
MARAGTTQASAYDNVVVTVPKNTGTTATEVQVQPSADAEAVGLLFISAAPSDKPLEYSLTETGTKIELDSPQLFMGAGAVGLLGAPGSLFFFNQNTGQDVEVQILVGRQAVVAP